MSKSFFFSVFRSQYNYPYNDRSHLSNFDSIECIFMDSVTYKSSLMSKIVNISNVLGAAGSNGERGPPGNVSLHVNQQSNPLQPTLSADDLPLDSYTLVNSDAGSKFCRCKRGPIVICFLYKAYNFIIFISFSFF